MINNRIFDDLQELGAPFLSVKFADLIGGRVEALEEFLGVSLKLRKIPPVNTKQHQKSNDRPRITFESLQDWERGRFDDICGDMMRRLGYSYDQAYL
mgnify:CR=1 FL=1